MKFAGIQSLFPASWPHWPGKGDTSPPLSTKTLVVTHPILLSQLSGLHLMPSAPSTCIVDRVSHLIAIDGAGMICVIVFEDFLRIENSKIAVTHNPKLTLPTPTLDSRLPARP